MTVVGVVGDIKGKVSTCPRRAARSTCLRCSWTRSAFFSPRALAIRTASNPASLAAAVQREIWAVNPNQTIANVRTLESIVEGQISDRKVQTGLFTAFAGLALFMAALGVYGLLSFVVTSRTREFGVRAAMGAQRRDLVSLIARDSAVVGGLRPRGEVRASRDRQSKHEQPDLWRRTSRLDVAGDLHVCAGHGGGSRRTGPCLASHTCRSDDRLAR